MFFDNKDNFVGSFYYCTCKFDRANDEFEELVVLKRRIIVVIRKDSSVYYYTDWSSIDEFCCQTRTTELWLNLRILAEIILET